MPRLVQGTLRSLHPLGRSFHLWSDANGLRMAVAMSFYGVLSLAPLLVISGAALGWWLNRAMLAGAITSQIGDLMGEQGAEVIRAAIASARQPGQGIVASVLAFILLMMGGAGVFAELQSAFERLWR